MASFEQAASSPMRLFLRGVHCSEKVRGKTQICCRIVPSYLGSFDGTLSHAATERCGERDRSRDRRADPVVPCVNGHSSTDGAIDTGSVARPISTPDHCTIPFQKQHPANDNACHVLHLPMHSILRVPPARMHIL